MEPTGEQPNIPSDYQSIDLYGGPCDGMDFALPTTALRGLHYLVVTRPCQPMAIEKLIDRGLVIPDGTVPICDHTYIRKDKKSLRFYFHSTTIG